MLGRWENGSDRCYVTPLVLVVAIVKQKSLGNVPPGIYAFSDDYAVVLLGALTRLGIRVPQEVALVGTDNLPIGEFVWPSLTSMSFDAHDIGKRAVDMLHALHQGLPLTEELTHSLIPQLIPREST